MLCAVRGRVLGARLIQALSLIVMFLGLTYSFVSNGFGVAPWGDWAGWERASEAMVLKRIEVDLIGRDVGPLGLPLWDNSDLTVFDRLAAPDEADETVVGDLLFPPYESEIGGQAYFWSFLWREAGCSSVSCLHLAGSALTAGVVVAIFVGLLKLTSMGFAWAWIIAMGASPWITYAARNAFWAPWVNLLPVIAAITFALSRSRSQRLVSGSLVFVAFLLKYVGTGYHEFITFTILAAVVPILVLIFSNRHSRGPKRQLVDSLLVTISSGAALVITLLVHAYLMAGNVIAGVQRIWTNTISRRTYGDPSSFDAAFSPSLQASPLDVLWMYLWSSWSTSMLSFSVDKTGSVFSVSLGRLVFAALILASSAVVIFRLLRSDSLWIRDGVLLVAGFASTALWLVAAKSYSFAHPHLLFFLWYLLFIPALLYVPGSFLWQFRKQIHRRVKFVGRQFDLELKGSRRE